MIHGHFFSLFSALNEILQLPITLKLSFGQSIIINDKMHMPNICAIMTLSCQSNIK